MDFEKVKKTVEEVLQQPKYRKLQQDVINPWEILKKNLWERFHDFVSQLNINWDIPEYRMGNEVDSILTVFLVIGIIFLIALVIGIIHIIRRNTKKNRRIGSLLQDLKDDKVTAEELMEKGKVYGEKSMFRDAVHYLLMGLLWKMNQKNLIYLSETKTNGQLIKELRKQNFKDIQGFSTLIMGFNDIWYGHREMDQAQYRIWLQIHEQLAREVQAYEQKEE